MDSFYNGESTNGEDGGFKEHRRLILSELKRLGRDQELCAERTETQITGLRDMFTAKFDSLQSQVAELRTEVKANERERKVLSGLYGLIGGALPIILWLLYQFAGKAG